MSKLFSEIWISMTLWGICSYTPIIINIFTVRYNVSLAVIKFYVGWFNVEPPSVKVCVRACCLHCHHHLATPCLTRTNHYRSLRLPGRFPSLRWCGSTAVALRTAVNMQHRCCICDVGSSTPTIWHSSRGFHLVAVRLLLAVNSCWQHSVTVPRVAHM